MRYFLIAICTVILFSCQKEKWITLNNPSSFKRIDEILVIKKADLEKSFSFLEGQAPVVFNNEVRLPSQVDDIDGDGKWDELAFLIDLNENEQATLKVEFVDFANYPTFEKRTNLRLGIKKGEHEFEEVDQYVAPNGLDGFPTIAQGESVSWENDKMGFRNYFDCRNVKDLFGKRKPGLIIDKIHTPDMGSYHELSDWGMDVLHCGSSLGAGGLAMLENDSLIRLGSTDVYEYQKVTEGPVRSVFDLIYKGWDVNGQKLAATERISIYPGKYWFQSDVTVSGFEGEKQLATGIVTSMLKNEPYQFKTNNDYTAIATLDKQSLNNDELGMAVMLPTKEMIKINRTTDINFYKLGYQTVPDKGFSHIISETYYIAQKIANDVPSRHYFFAFWGLEDPKWKEIQNIKDYMSYEADKLSSPVTISVQ